MRAGDEAGLLVEAAEVTGQIDDGVLFFEGFIGQGVIEVVKGQLDFVRVAEQQHRQNEKPVRIFYAYMKIIFILEFYGKLLQRGNVCDTMTLDLCKTTESGLVN